MVVKVPLPVFTTPAGVLVTVQSPVPGNPLNATSPVDTVQVGGVMAPTVGGDGTV